MADFPAKVRAKFHRPAPARSPLSTVQAVSQHPEDEQSGEQQKQQQEEKDQQQDQEQPPTHPLSQPQQPRRATWSLRSRRTGGSHLRRTPLAVETMEEKNESGDVSGRSRTGRSSKRSRSNSHSPSHRNTATAPDQSSGRQNQEGSDQRAADSTGQSTTREMAGEGEGEHHPINTRDPNDNGSSVSSNNNRDDSTKSQGRASSSNPYVPSASPRRPYSAGTTPGQIELPSINPSSPSILQSPEQDRITRTVLEEYEAELEAQPESSSRPLPSRSSTSNRNSNSNSNSNSNTKLPSLARRQSILPQQDTALIRSLLGSAENSTPLSEISANYPATLGEAALSPSMVNRKIWVKRPGASATLVTVLEDHLVDDVRDMILRKYANTLGRSFDSPDVSLRVVPRENRQERTLGPEEPICQVLDGYFPGGQTVDEALVIDVPLRRTPKPSPQPVPVSRYYQEEERRPPEAASEYFPPMPVPTVPSPHLPGMMSTLAPLRDRSPSSASLALDVRPHYWPRP